MTVDRCILALADLVLFIHLLVVAFVVVGLALILLGGRYNWAWVRNPWIRTAHLACIATVALQAWAGIICPLTTLEMWLRQQAGETAYAGSFISHWMSAFLYFDLPTWVFTLVYTIFGLLVAAAWWWVRPLPYRKICNKP